MKLKKHFVYFYCTVICDEWRTIHTPIKYSGCHPKKVVQYNFLFPYESYLIQKYIYMPKVGTWCPL